MPNDLEAIELCFVAYRKGSVKEAREIEVRATQRLTELINQDKKLYPFLREFPFPTHRVEISLSFRQPDDSYYSDGSLAYTFQVRGILRYKVNNPKTDKFVFLHQEPFEEAQKIIKSDGNNTFAKKLSNKSECTSIQYEKASSKDDSGKDYDIMSNTMQNALKERINKLNVQYGLSE
ncbi:MAG TPA: hypothetical protein VLG49_05930 [Rhabdochlamydiaceae bacterium]|nr:hypothetical protein [Rhabdochlamydiaceae bacterium]